MEEYVKKITIAAASQDVRPNYAGVYIQLQSGRLKLVATDTYRLAFLSLPYQEEIPTSLCLCRYVPWVR